MWFKVIPDNPDRAYNSALERRKVKPTPSEKDHYSYPVRIGKSHTPPNRAKPIGWEPDNWYKEGV